MAQSNELGFGPVRGIQPVRGGNVAYAIHVKPYHGKQRKKVRGGIPPRTLRIWSKCMFKPLKHTPQTRDKAGNPKYISKNCPHHIK